METTKLTSKERIANLEEEVGCMSKKLDEIIRLLQSQDNRPFTVQSIKVPAANIFDDTKELFRKPIMYLYNMTGMLQNITVDFGSMVLPDSIPEVRDDGKITFNLDADSYINGKYKYLYYEIEYDKPLPKPATTITISNDKSLEDGLSNLAVMCGLWSNEVTDFVAYWDLELKRSDCKFWKCDVYTEKELDPILPIEIFPKPAFFIRRYVRFTESEVGQKVNNKLSKDVRFQTPSRTGEVRVVEWGGVISESGIII